ncbi:hypothetical protein [Mycolicibacter sinensis]|uniref:hypothetical protein n=1 Tax=Mycolicibacter sinensis (strain JDM601) TaxID=875328 RepID=UPI000A951EA0|nr:hypothetical protein [Mycolicibacter sinensis]
MISGDGKVGIGYVSGDEIGVAFERSKQASEFGLPETYCDPTDYHGKTPASEKIIGL